MRKIILSAMIVVLMSATAFADGSHKGKVQTRWGTPVDLGVPPEFAPCSYAVARAEVHHYGVRFSIKAWGCKPGHVLSVWGLIGPDPNDLSIPTLNCGGGVVFPNGSFKTICDVPIGNLTDTIDQCQGIPAPDFFGFSLGGGCAQSLAPGYFGKGGFFKEDFHLDILSHDNLEKDISMAQIRTTTTCAFWDDFGVPGQGYDRADSCTPIRISFPAPKRH